MRKVLFSISLVALIGIHAEEAKAQVNFGAHANWASETEVGLGARANITVPVENLKIVPSFDYFFPPNSIPGASTSYMELNGNAHYSFPLENNPKLLPYAGGGLNFGRVSASGGGVTVSETKAGLNLLGGVQFGSLGSLRPFAEMRYSTTYDGQFIISGGINF